MKKPFIIALLLAAIAANAQTYSNKWAFDDITVGQPTSEKKSTWSWEIPHVIEHKSRVCKYDLSANPYDCISVTNGSKFIINALIVFGIPIYLIYLLIRKFRSKR